MRTLDDTTWHILLAMADDWESIVQIQGTLREFGFDIPDAAVFQTLRELHQEAYVKIMGPNGTAVDSFPDDPIKHWFYFTPAGEGFFRSGEAQFRRPEPEA